MKERIIEKLKILLMLVVIVIFLAALAWVTCNMHSFGRPPIETTG